jgi:hypothetical protein
LPGLNRLLSNPLQYFQGVNNAPITPWQTLPNVVYYTKYDLLQAHNGYFY